MSDQDFFFEDEQDVAAKDAPVADTAGEPQPEAGSAVSAGAQTVTMNVAALIGVIALLAGVIIGVVIPTGPAGAPVTGATQGATQGANPGAAPGASNAPQLTPEQLKGGELPPNHPPVGSAAGQSSETTAK